MPLQQSYYGLSRPKSSAQDFQTYAEIAKTLADTNTQYIYSNAWPS